MSKGPNKKKLLSLELVPVSAESLLFYMERKVMIWLSLPEEKMFWRTSQKRSDPLTQEER